MTLRHRASHRAHRTHLFLNSEITVVKCSFPRTPRVSVLAGRQGLPAPGCYDSAPWFSGHCVERYDKTWGDKKRRLSYAIEEFCSSRKANVLLLGNLNVISFSDHYFLMFYSYFIFLYHTPHIHTDRLDM